MNPSGTINADEIKRQSESIILKAGGGIYGWLPVIDFSEARSLSEVVDRALIFNALIQLLFEAPPEIVEKWETNTFARFTIHDSRFTIHDSRFTIHDSRLCRNYST